MDYINFIGLFISSPMQITIIRNVTNNAGFKYILVMLVPQSLFARQGGGINDRFSKQRDSKHLITCKIMTVYASKVISHNV